MKLKYIAIGTLSFAIAEVFGILARQFPQVRAGIALLMVAGLVVASIWALDGAYNYAQHSDEGWSTKALVLGATPAIALCTLLLVGFVCGIYGGAS